MDSFISRFKFKLWNLKLQFKFYFTLTDAERCVLSTFTARRQDDGVILAGLARIQQQQQLGCIEWIQPDVDDDTLSLHAGTSLYSASWGQAERRGINVSVRAIIRHCSLREFLFVCPMCGERTGCRGGQRGTHIRQAIGRVRITRENDRSYWLLGRQTVSPTDNDHMFRSKRHDAAPTPSGSGSGSGYGNATDHPVGSLESAAQASLECDRCGRLGRRRGRSSVLDKILSTAKSWREYVYSTYAVAAAAAVEWRQPAVSRPRLQQLAVRSTAYCLEMWFFSLRSSSHGYPCSWQWLGTVMWTASGVCVHLVAIEQSVFETKSNDRRTTVVDDNNNKVREWFLFIKKMHLL